MNDLDPRICRRARLARDRRFDGEFFLAVTTTGIYCRPVCPARPPRERNVRYFRTAAEAGQQGFRPCLRCRPESAPSSPAWRGTATTVGRAMQLINEGYLNRHSLAQLAARLGVGERYLRKLFEAQVGAAPSAVAHTQRLHFAQKLLLETALPITEIAFASGFGSVRRFNSATRAAFGCAASELRRSREGVAGASSIELELSYRPPYDWESVLNFFARHAVDGLEQVVDGHYCRTLSTAGGWARIDVSAHPRKPALVLQLKLSDNAELMPVVTLVRRMLDLDAQPHDIAEVLGADALLQELLQRFPGVRAPLLPSPFESAVRAVVGQQVSIQAARGVCARLLRACDSFITVEGHATGIFPRPSQIAALPDSEFPMPGRRRDTLREVCRYFAEADAGDQARVIADLGAIRGIGPWTLAVLAMRGFGDPDVFPVADLGLLRAADTSAARLGARAESWKPWRSYAANLLWRSISQ